MPIRTPPQHQTDPAKAPGTITTIGDYIAVKSDKFESWWSSVGSKIHVSDANSKSFARLVWDASK